MPKSIHSGLNAQPATEIFSSNLQLNDNLLPTWKDFSIIKNTRNTVEALTCSKYLFFLCISHLVFVIYHLVFGFNMTPSVADDQWMMNYRDCVQKQARLFYLCIHLEGLVSRFRFKLSTSWIQVRGLVSSCSSVSVLYRHWTKCVQYLISHLATFI
jgi:hypothetical protein